MTQTPADGRTLANRSTLILAAILGAAQIGYLLALRGQLVADGEDGWALVVFVAATVLAVGGWALLAAHALASRDSTPAGRVSPLPTAALATGMTALGLFIALVVLAVALSVGDDLMALGAFAEGAATVVLVYQAWTVRTRQ